MSYKSVWDFGREGKANYGVHAIGEYPSKIRPIVFSIVVDRFSERGDVILDPFCGSGTLAVEAKIQGRNSINYDINPYAVKLAQKKLSALDKSEMISMTRELLEEYKKELKKAEKKFERIQIEKEIKKLEERLREIKENEDYCNTFHIIEVQDARNLPLENESIDAIITDIPYANMIKYSDIPEDLSTIDDYELFLKELEKCTNEMWRVLRRGKYCVIFCADHRIAASRKILPVHVDVVNIMRNIGFTLFDIYIWRYYRSGGFRPFGKPPYQAMNLHIYILVFYKPVGNEVNKMNRPIRYRPRLVEKLKKSKVEETSLQDFC
ncbi:MAG: tRNA G10 N-methylase Trm11 [Methanophagales archaeon]|nr:DNA methyltransferase [Methanophagales archaeon]MCU4140797.1 tRNA G10 N-methylase Trm11 [Methanophagales archaeon]